MAARRLLIVMLILLGFATLAAALVPTRPVGDQTTATTTTEPTETEAPDLLPRGEGLAVGIEVGGEEVPVVPIKLGDQLELTIRSQRTDLLEIPALGLVEPVSPGTPARFNLLPRDAGSYGIRFIERDRVVARIEVEERTPAKGTSGSE